ncbi:MAG TPA: tyrosine-type recombinase/integrase [Rariglobus sp.]
MADTMADMRTGREGVTQKRRRQYGTGTVYQRHDGRWAGSMEAGWTTRGTRRRVTVVAATEAEAKRRLKEKHRAALAGEQVGGRKVTVKAWVQTWLDAQARRVRPKTLETDTSVMRRWVVPTIGHRQLGALTPADIRKVTDAVREAGRTSTTAGYVHAVLVRSLKAAVREGHVVPDRVFLTDKPEPATSSRQALTLPDAVAILTASQALPDRSRWVAALLQGMRQGECLGLTWDMVDFGRARIDVSWQLQTLRYADRARDRFVIPDGYEARRLEGAWHLTRPKTARGQRIIPMLGWMVEPLRAWQEVAPASPHGLVWPRANGLPRSAKADREAWVALQDAAQVAAVDGTTGRRYLVHEARHTTANLLLAAKVDQAIVTALLGHSSYAVSQGYMHVDDAMLRDALGKVGRLVITP